ncbi:MAG: AzlD domain-containing protein [Brachybacterium sp.]|nr:AzlD domain-containing protein [Brachybacterium sp.]
MSALAIGVVVASVLSFVQKWIGYQVPPEGLEGPRISRVLMLLPVALLAALVAVQTLGDGQQLHPDARLAGLAAAATLLWLRAPFLVVVVGAAATAAVLRMLGVP